MQKYVLLAHPSLCKMQNYACHLFTVTHRRRQMAILYDRDENIKIKSTVYAVLTLKMSQSLCLFTLEDSTLFFQEGKK